MSLFGHGIPMGIPLIPDLGNSRFGNSTSLDDMHSVNGEY